MASQARFFIEQLAQRLRESDLMAQRAEREAREAARTLATESEKREDGRAAIEFGSMASGQSIRAAVVQQEMQALVRFCNAGIPDYGLRSGIGLGAIIDVRVDSEGGAQERSFIVLPAGAGAELHGPGGDGFLTVITPSSPVGRALLGKRTGETIDVTLAGEPVEWTVTHVG